MSKLYLYIIVNRVNGKKYVGITNNLQQRRREHYSGNGSKIIWQAIQKYGANNLVMCARYAADELWIKEMEQTLIRVLNTRSPNGYNLTDGGEGSLGWKPSEETRKKMSEAHKGKTMWPRSKETRHNISESRKGKRNRQSQPITIQGVIYDSLGEAARVFGWTNRNCFINRVRRLRSEARWPAGWWLPTTRIQKARRPATKETKRKMSRARMGKKLGPMSEETKQRISQARLRNSKPRDEHPDACPVVIDGVRYDTIKTAAEEIGVNYSTLRWRFQKYKRTNQWPSNWSLAT